jgi:hypothetical protein
MEVIMSISFEKIKIMEKHSLVIKPLMDLFNQKYMPITPAVECKDHPLHHAYVNSANKIIAISETLLEMFEEREL